jgi:phenylpropionate dioxygenase-like ring-hydroxylating dioxygenase large terminal subunit
VIPNEYYYSAEVFDREMRSLFASRYHFAALTTELENDRDFVCVDYHGTSIVVQNFKGTIRAFQNVCTHRFKPYSARGARQRPPDVPVHGWSFDKEGYLPASPTRRSSWLKASTSRTCVLLAIPVETCGSSCS